MKIVIYCQHVLGIGHLMRTLAICRALHRHELILVSGGEPLPLALPAHVKEIRLPSLMMNAAFQDLHHPASMGSLEKVKSMRTDQLWNLFMEESPDLFLVELYPFGRKAFRFELDPILEGIRSGMLPHCRVVCSVRDILVEKEKADVHESRALGILNRLFDAILIHADPEVISLNQTFSAFADISIPTIYTGYVSDPLPAVISANVRRKLGRISDTKLVVVSAGGGKVGSTLLRAVAKAHAHLPQTGEIRMTIFTGPYADDALWAELQSLSSNLLSIERFSDDFIHYLKAADLSISMAGYNTCMNVLAVKIPALVFPFEQNREQGLRAERLSELGALRRLTVADLVPSRLAQIILSELGAPVRSYPTINLNGASASAQWIEKLC